MTVFPDNKDQIRCPRKQIVLKCFVELAVAI